MKFTQIIFFFLLFGSLSFIACSSDDDVDCDNEAAVAQLFNDGAQAVLDATEAWVADPSESNCLTLRSTYSDWIDDLEGFQGCADQAGQGDEYRDAIQQSREALDTIPCG